MLNKQFIFLIFALLFPANGFPVFAASNGFDRNHSLFEQVLSRYVIHAHVDYRGMAANTAALDAYLAGIAGVSRREFDSWSRDDQLAMLINLYNAQTLKLITDHYPVQSIRQIGTIFRGPWSRKIVSLFGGMITLDNLEHDIIRPSYNVPEVHFALVCAAKGCPPLRGEPYRGGVLSGQLADQRRRFLSDPDKNRIGPEARTVHLSPIFKWYGGDFAKAAGSVRQYLSSWWPGHEGEITADFDIEYTRYDWDLNEVRPAPEGRKK